MSYAPSKQLTHYLRVKETLGGGESDQIPKGEFFFPRPLLERLTGRPVEDFFSAASRALSELGADFVVLSYNATADIRIAAPRSVEEISLWAELTDYFIFVVVDGVFWPIVSKLGFNETCRLAVRDPQKYAEMAETYALASASLARWCIGAGAHGVIIADDLAGSGQPLFSPELLRRLVFPPLMKLVMKLEEEGVPLVFHSDGKITGLLEDIVALGVDAVHGLSGHDILGSKEKYPGVTFIGGLDAAELDVPKDEKSFSSLSDRIASLARGGRFIFSSDGGLCDDSPLETLKQVYGIANAAG